VAETNNGHHSFVVVTIILDVFPVISYKLLGTGTSLAET